MKRITKEDIKFITNNILKEIDIHFKTKQVLSQAINREFEFWKVKEYDILLEFNHYCNLRGLSFTDEDIKFYHNLLKFEAKIQYDFNCIIKSISTAIFYLDEE